VGRSACWSRWCYWRVAQSAPVSLVLLAGCPVTLLVLAAPSHVSTIIARASGGIHGVADTAGDIK